MNILIVGGTRFVGRRLALDLRSRGHRVTVLNRGVTPDDLPADVERLRADRTQPAELEHAIGARDFDAVVDLAAYRGEEARGAIEVFGGRTGRYVFISSGQVYLVLAAPVDEPAREEAYDGEVMPAPPAGSRDHAEWAYGVGKRECEDVLREARDEAGFPATVLRLPMVNGERDNYQRLEAYVARAEDGGPILVPAGPARPLRHVLDADVVRIVADMLETGTGLGGTYNLSPDEALGFEEFLTIVREALGKELRVREMPRETLESQGLLPACSPFSERWMSVIENGRAKRELGCRFTPAAAYLPGLVRSARDVPPERVRGYAQRAREVALARETA